MLLFNKQAMFHSSSVKEAAGEAQGGMHLPFHPRTEATNSGDLPVRDLWVRGHGNANGFLKGQRSTS